MSDNPGPTAGAVATNELSNDVHTLYHKFLRQVDPYDNDEHDIPLYRRVDLFIDENPEVKMSYCDDDHFMSAYMIWVPHESETDYMGVTVHFFKQGKAGLGETDGDDVCYGEAFMYPSHLDSLLDVASHFHSKRMKNTTYRLLTQCNE